ncbi:MAG: MATE family efflux transporter [Treponemataceae bacterium]
MEIDRLKGSWQEVVRIAAPAVLESLFLSLTVMIDTIMVSSLGKYAVAAVGLTAQPKFFFLTVYIAMSVSVSALVARRKGENDQEAANETLLTALILSVIFCVIISFVSVVFAFPILELAGSNEETHEASVLYFRIIMGGMFFNIISIIINAAQRGSGNTHIAFTTNFVSTITNIFFNYVLIGGNLGFPKWGIAGAAIATVLGTVAAFVMSVASLFRKESFVQITYMIEHKVKASLKTVGSIFNLASSIALENLAMRVGFATTAFTAARLGTTSFATHQAGMNILSLGFAFADGMQVAAVTLTGQSLGAKNKPLAKKFGDTCQKIGFLISVALAIFLFFAGDKIFKLYFDDPVAVKKGTMIARFIMVIVLAQISQIIFAGALRAAGDVKYTLFVSIVSVTVIRTLITIVLVRLFHLGLVGIWCGILSDQASRFFLFRHRYKQGKWLDIKI